MNLKEAFRFQNKLQSLLDETKEILSAGENITRVQNTYYYSKVMPEAKDVTIPVEPITPYYDRITDICRFALYLLEEKERLSAAIRRAKNALPMDMDSEVSLNAARQQVAQLLKSMNDLRSTEMLLHNGGQGYRFNAEGNQISYLCDVKCVTTINFDRNVIRAQLTRLNRHIDEVSAQIDLCTVTAQVDYQPPFDVNDSFSAVFEAFAD